MNCPKTGWSNVNGTSGSRARGRVQAKKLILLFCVEAKCEGCPCSEGDSFFLLAKTVSRWTSNVTVSMGGVSRPAIRVIQLTWERDCQPVYLYRELGPRCGCASDRARPRTAPTMIWVQLASAVNELRIMEFLQHSVTVARRNRNLQDGSVADIFTHLCTCLPKVKGVSDDVIKDRSLLILYRVLEEAHRFLSGNFDGKHAIRIVREYPAVQCDKLWWLGWLG